MAFEAGTIPTAEEWADAIGRIVTKTADQSVTSSTTLVNDTHLLFAGLASTNYKFRMVGFVTGSINGDIKLGFTFPSLATIHWMGYGIDSAATTQAGNLQSAGYVNSTTVDQTLIFNAHGNGCLVVAEGFIQFSTNAGNLRLRWAQGTSNATSTTLLKGSSLEWKKV